MGTLTELCATQPESSLPDPGCREHKFQGFEEGGEFFPTPEDPLSPFWCVSADPSYDWTGRQPPEVVDVKVAAEIA